MTLSTSNRSTFILLFYLLFPCIHGSCPKCDKSSNKHQCDCESNCYWNPKQGIPTCERCTTICSEYKNQVEVTPCTQESNRVCHCKPGFYCKKGNNYNTHCHKKCLPCETGTFSSKPSLDPSCKPHKDCAQLGMITLIEGTATQDRKCVYATTSMSASSTPSITTIAYRTDPTQKRVPRETLVKEGTVTQDGESVNATTSMSASSTPSITTISYRTAPTQNTEGTETEDRESVNAKTKMAASSTSSSFITISSSSSPPLRTEVAPQQDGKPEENQSLWMLTLIFMLMFLFMAGVCMLMKCNAPKTLSKCFGLINGKYEVQQHWRQVSGDTQILSNAQSNASTNHNMETEIPLGSDVRGVKGQSMGMTPQSGGVQQVTVEHNGKGENVSNTVGSIYIYSPGMVILGSNSSDKKEEAGVCEEAHPLIGSPQQESNPPSQEVRIRMSAQEEAEKELSLSFPVPATGK
ncbi:tumor necrosis factor receptor superfamily member 8 isoform X2 [Pseudorasbora parva]|uniref:tumor necrosis factor receptor superfamily member 8 isoform X2 n=1 Tax=Pseudorasbora parva TaxID=51549 RepID=UPI00351F257F